jgi:hypothetical protein
MIEFSLTKMLNNLAKQTKQKELVRPQPVYPLKPDNIPHIDYVIDSSVDDSYPNLFYLSNSWQEMP